MHFCWSLKNVLVLIYSKLYSKSCGYLHKIKVYFFDRAIHFNMYESYYFNIICIEAGPLSRKLFWPPIIKKLCTYSVVTSLLAYIRFVHALKLIKSKKARKLSSVIKMTKKKAVSTQLKVFFFSSFQHWAFTCLVYSKNVDKQKLT